jgi:dCMP deaminase
MEAKSRYNLKLQTFAKMALQIADLGTCCRAKVGAVLLRKDWSVASCGYNGALSHMKHCDPSTCNSDHRCIHTAHAEENAIFFSEGPIYYAFITHEPCLNCTRMMARRGVKFIYFLKPYTSIPELEAHERTEILKYYEIKMQLVVLDQIEE